MYLLKEIKGEIMDWNHKNSAKTKCVRVSVIMEMLNEKQQAKVETVFNEFVEKIKEIVPDNPPADGEQKVY